MITFDCYFCGKNMNKQSRERYEKDKLQCCNKCNDWLDQMILKVKEESK